MTDPSNESLDSVNLLLDRVNRGDSEALNALITYSAGRLRRLASRTLRNFPTVHAFEDSSDVLQLALVRLVQSLKSVHPTNLTQFLSLAALQIRRELLDLARRYNNSNRYPSTDAVYALDESGQPLDQTAGPFDLSIWTEFHGQVENLPEPEKAVFDLLFYTGLSQPEAAQVLGISERTVRSRWLRARMHLMKKLRD